MPDVRRVGVDDEPRLLVQLPAQCRERQLTGLDAAAGGCRTRPLRPSGPLDAGGGTAQQDTVVLGRMTARTARLSLAVAGVSFTCRSSGRQGPGGKPGNGHGYRRPTERGTTGGPQRTLCGTGRPGAARDSSCRSPIMNLMEDQQAPQSAEGEAKVITLCGSTKFEAEFAEVNQRLTMEGCVVISLGMFSLPDLPDYDWTADSSDLKGRLGGVHFQKIRMADEVYIVDPGGYVGESTRREIAYAESLGKPVRYLSRERLARTGDGPQE